MNFAAAASQPKTKEARLAKVQLEGHVVLKIVKHCQECAPDLVTGQLLGLDVGSTLEVTDAFPFPSRGDEDSGADVGAEYQLNMMRCLREVNADNNTVGWYQSTVMGSFQSLDLIETFISYQDSIKRCIAITVDPHAYASGSPALKAIKLRDGFMELYKSKGAQGLTAEKLKAANIGWADAFEEIPVSVQNSALVSALMAQVAPAGTGTGEGDYQRLGLAMAPALGRTAEYMSDAIDELQAEAAKVSFYHRSAARQQQQQAAFVQKRRQENAARRAANEEPLPEEEPGMFKPIPEPSQLDNLLLSNQMAAYADAVNGIGGAALQKLFLLNSLQSAQA